MLDFLCYDKETFKNKFGSYQRSRFMTSSPIWISLRSSQSKELLLKMQELLSSKEKIPAILETSTCRARCTGTCGSLQSKK
jgi:hypothetical protein